MSFEEYLVSKKIDQKRFQQAEPGIYASWKTEFDFMHPNSFTAQKLYLINPIRRKYTLKEDVIKTPIQSVVKAVEEVKPAVEKVESSSTAAPQASTTETQPASDTKPATSPAKPARPVFKPKPKIN